MAKYLPILAITFTFLGILQCYASDDDSRKVYIVLLDPSLESTKDVALEFLAKVVEGRTPAESLVYVYKNVVTGFAARLTVKEAEKLARLQGVLSVIPEQNYQIGNPTAYGLELSEKSAGEISPISS
ncbi:cucumisin [Citrus sinensis]|uniref:cucumisin n=1 Tax=Citrus sinensis TaxID=2711 RepID=UPI000D62A8E8|nr:cucumisin [Citrus sinensis]